MKKTDIGFDPCICKVDINGATWYYSGALENDYVRDSTPLHSLPLLYTPKLTSDIAKATLITMCDKYGYSVSHPSFLVINLTEWTERTMPLFETKVTLEEPHAKDC